MKLIYIGSALTGVGWVLASLKAARVRNTGENEPIDPVQAALFWTGIALVIWGIWKNR